MTVKVPYNVLQGIIKLHQSGESMYDYDMTCVAAAVNDEWPLWYWMRDNKPQYRDGLFFGFEVGEPEPKPEKELDEMSQDEKFVAKIQKLLALAGNNPNAEEAQAALLKARELMVQHGIEEDQLADGQQKPKEIVEIQVPEVASRASTYYMQLVAIIGQNFRCYTFFYTRHKKRIPTFFGIKTDAEAAKQALIYAYAALEHNLQVYTDSLYQSRGFVGRDRNETTAIKNTWVTGFLKGLNEAFKKQEEEQQWGLVLVKDKEVTDKFGEYKFKSKIETSRPRTTYDQAAFNDGFEKGKSFVTPAGLVGEN